MHSTCPQCGVSLEPGAAVCPICSRPLSAIPSALGGSIRSRTQAGLFGILLGGFGAHNFYLGFKKRALVQLLVSLGTCGLGLIPMTVWGVAEGILILRRHPKYTADAAKKTLYD